MMNLIPISFLIMAIGILLMGIALIKDAFR